MTAARLTVHARSGDGFVLVTVLWLLALLGMLLSAMALHATGAVGTLDVSGQRVIAQAALESGLNRGVVAMRDARRSSGRDAGALGTAQVSTAWTAETARIDINFAPAALLAGLFARLGASPDEAAGFADRIVGLRGFPPERKREPGEAFHESETPAAIYAAAHRLDAQPDPHRPFVDVAQLAQVAGLPAALMTRAAPFLTTYSGVATIDPAICAPEVIEALPDMTRERLRTLMERRERPEGGDLDDALGPSKIYTSGKPASATRFLVRATLSDGLSMAAEVVVVAFEADRVPYRILSWEEEAPALAPGSRGAAP